MTDIRYLVAEMIEVKNNDVRFTAVNTRMCGEIFGDVLPDGIFPSTFLFTPPHDVSTVVMIVRIELFLACSAVCLMTISTITVFSEVGNRLELLTFRAMLPFREAFYSGHNDYFNLAAHRGIEPRTY